MDFKNLLQDKLDENTIAQILIKIEEYIKKEVCNRIYKEKANYETELDKLKKISLIETELMLFGARNIKAALALIDLESIDFNNFDIENIKQKIKKLKTNQNTAFLFNKEEDKVLQKGFKPFDSYMYREKPLSNMNYEELCRYYDDELSI